MYYIEIRAGIIGKNVWVAPTFVSAAKDAVGGNDNYSGKFGEEEVSMLLVDRKGVAYFKKSVAGMAKYA